MWDLVKKHFGIIVGLALSVLAYSENKVLHLIYSVALAVLACIILFRFIGQAIKSRRAEEMKEYTLIDDIVDNLTVVRAIELAQEPTKEGKKIKKKFIVLLEATKKIMKTLKQFFDKFKGYILTFALAILTGVEMYGGFINDLCGGVLVIGEVEVIPVVTLIATVVIGILSNGYTKDQNTKIKALFSKSSINELVMDEIKKTYKETSAKLTQFNKILDTQETELANLKSELESACNTYHAKREMFNMTPQLATEEDVMLAANACQEIETKIEAKQTEINESMTAINNLKTTINALKSQLQGG